MGKKGKKGKSKIPKNPGSFYELAMRLRKEEGEDLDISLNRAFLRKDTDQCKESMELLRKKWRQMTGAKGQENVKDHCLKTWHTFEKAVEKKDLLIAHLQEDLDAVIKIRKLSYKDYLGVMDKSIMMYKSQVDDIYQDYIKSTEQCRSEYQKYTEKFDGIKNAALDRLRIALYCIETKEREDDQLRKAKPTTRINELRDQRLSDLKILNVHEHELQTCFKEMCEIFKEYEGRMAEIKARAVKGEFEEPEIICNDTVEFMSLKNRISLQTIRNLENEYKHLKNKWMNYKKLSRMEIRKEEDRFKKMIGVSGLAIDELKRLEAKVSSVVKLENHCKKLLTDEEIRIRFPSCTEDKDDESTNLSTNFTIEQKIKKFWELNAECVKLKNYLLFEKQRLKDENLELKNVLEDLEGSGSTICEVHTFCSK